jgi:hypothetical protein
VGRAQQNQKKTAEPKSETNALAALQINTLNRKQTPSIQNSTETGNDVRNSAMGDSFKFQHRNPPERSNQDSPIPSERILAHKQPEDP